MQHAAVGIDGNGATRAHWSVSDGRMVIQAGGLPIRIGGAPVGGISVGGAPSSDIDAGCATADLTAIGADT